uniref:Endoplasmic reticulum transmembrane protein n=1 Tax=Terrapene triunguis TaxID=2587831 RepID=A0A674K1A8_9SAUR
PNTLCHTRTLKNKTKQFLFLFSDAIREVKKYSAAHGTEKAANINPNAYDHIQVKLFRSQRNLYISGFSLFLWLVLRRTVTLITQLAKEMGIQVAMEIQVANTNEAARKYMEENEKLQQALNEKGKCENEQALEEDNKKLRKETEKLKAELKKTSNGNFFFNCFLFNENDLAFYA